MDDEIISSKKFHLKTNQSIKILNTHLNRRWLTEEIKKNSIFKKVRFNWLIGIRVLKFQANPVNL